MNKNIFSLFFTSMLFAACCNLSFGNMAYSNPLIQDNLVNTTLKDKPIEAPLAHLEYNYQNTLKVPIRLTITENILSEKDVFEGQVFNFTVSSNVVHKGKIVIKKGTIAQGRVETIITSGMNGIPASIIWGDFQFENIDNGKITNFYKIDGQNRSLWVFPLKWALTPIPPTGSLTNFIKGGHANLETSDIIQIYYHPNWI